MSKVKRYSMTILASLGWYVYRCTLCESVDHYFFDGEGNLGQVACSVCGRVTHLDVSVWEVLHRCVWAKFDTR